jgi:hypothetical protein
MADRHGRLRRHARGRSKLVIRALALGVLAALAAGAALAADRGDCRYAGYDGYAGTSGCDERALPVIDTESPTGRKNGKLRLSADRAGNAETVVWDFDGDGYDDAAGETNPVVDLPAAGPRTIGLKVTDPHGRSATAERTVGVHEGNVAPDLQIYPDGRDVVPVGSPYRLGALMRDLDDGAVDVTVDFGDGTVQQYDDFTEYDEIEHPYASGGEKLVTVTASDGQHDTIVSFTARIGGPAGQVDPAIYSIDVHPPRAGRPTQLVESAYDPDDPGSPLAYAWDLDGDGEYDDGSTFMVTHTFPAGGPVTYGVRIRDANNGETIVRRTVVPTEINVEPQASIYVDPLEPRAGMPFTVLGYGYDFDGDFGDVTLSYDVDEDGQFDDHVGEDEFDLTFLDKGTYSLAVRAEDADGAFSIHRVDLVVATAAPTGEFTWSPRKPDPGTPVTFTGTGEDPDREDDVELEWDLDGDVQWDDQDGPTASRTFDTQGWHPVSLRVTDADGDIEVVTHYIPVGNVINHDPKADLTWSPAAPRAGDLVTFTSTATDPDGETLAYWWDLDGDEAYDDGRGATTTRTFAAAGTYQVVLYVEDPRDGWDEVVRTVTVGPAPPGGGGGGGGGSASPPPDTTAPTLTVNPIAKSALKLKTVVGKGLKVPVACSESCMASLELRVDKATAKKLKIAKKAVVVGKASGPVGVGGTLTIKLTSKAKKGLKRAKTVKLTLQGTAVDAAGNRSVLPARKLTLKK